MENSKFLSTCTYEIQFHLENFPEFFVILIFIFLNFEKAQPFFTSLL